MQFFPGAKYLALSRQFAQHMWLNGADDGCWVALSRHKIEPAAGIKAVFRHPQHPISQQIAAPKIKKEPSIQSRAANGILNAFLVHALSPRVVLFVLWLVSLRRH